MTNIPVTDDELDYFEPGTDELMDGMRTAAGEATKLQIGRAHV